MTTRSENPLAGADLAIALEAGDIGAWEWHIPAGRVTWSGSLERLHGLPPGTFPGTFEAYQRDIHPDDRERVLATFDRTVRERQPHHLEYRIVRSDGSVRWLEERGRLFCDEAGAPQRVIGVCTDVTARREREDAWRASEARRQQAEVELEEQTRLALLSRDIGLALTREGELRDVLQRCVQAVVDHLGAAFARIWTLNDADQVLELQVSAGMYTHTNGPHGRVPIGKYKIGWIAQERVPHLTNQVLGDSRVGDQEWARREGMVAFAGYPLIVGDTLVGVLAMFARRELSPADFEGLATVANALALGVARARAYADIRASEERYRFLAEAAPTQVWTAAPDGTVDYSNTQSYAYFGVNLADVPKDGQQAMVHPDDAGAVFEHWARSLATGEPLDMECRLRRHDGEFRWHIVRARALRDGSGRVAKWFGTNTDIHDAKMVRLALAARAQELARVASELQYQRDLTTTIADNAASALFMIDSEGYPIFMNAAAAEMTGYRGLDEIRDRPLHYAIHFRKADGSPYPMEECPIDQANATVQRLRTQREMFCRKDGTLFPVEYNVAPIVRDGRQLGAVIEVRDITEELEAQQALRESDERFHLLTRATNDTIWDWDIERGVLWWNENFSSMFGYDLADLEPGLESWTSRIHPDDLQRVSDSIHGAIEGTASVWSDEYRFRRADGSYADILDRGLIVRDAGGRGRRMIGSMMDVTDRKRAEMALRRHADELAALALALQRSNQDLDQFAYVASHDLKAPLRGIANLSQWIEEDLGSVVTDQSREHLNLLRSRVHRMEALIDGILEYSRAGRVAGPEEQVAVGRLVSDVLELLGPPRMQIDVAPGMPTFRTQRLPLQQVFMNLIGNAVKHAGSGADPRITIAAQRVPEGYAFTVADNGPGIAPAFHDKIWGIFQTLQPRDKVEGTGIGLALVKKIVESRGGRVWVESAEGAGATFGFTWPLHTAGENA